MVDRRGLRRAEAGGAAGGDAFRQTAAEPYAAAVQDVELLAGGDTAVVALRDTCRLRLYGLAAAREVGQVNLNPMGDEHVGFVVMQLALSPDGGMLAVSTDGPRILVLRVAGAPGPWPCCLGGAQVLVRMRRSRSRVLAGAHGTGCWGG